METRKTGQDLMALWRTTGGADEAATACEGGDDGLRAAFTMAGGGGICVDEGLTMGPFTNNLQVCADDGLEAGAYSLRYACHIDDGLAAV